MPNPLVSVCVPCHNAGPYVKQALRSIFEQTHDNFEVILVNDGATDDTADVLATFDDPPLHIINQKCGSASKSRNLAFKHSKGDYIKDFDADDILSPGMLEAQVARLEQHERAIASCEWGRFYKKNLSSYTPNRQSVWRDMSSKEWLIESFRDARPMMQPAIFLITRPLIEEVGGWDERLSPIDDFEFFARLLSAARDIKFCEGQTLYYRSGLENALSGKNRGKPSREPFIPYFRAPRPCWRKKTPKQPDWPAPICSRISFIPTIRTTPTYGKPRPIGSQS